MLKLTIKDVLKQKPFGMIGIISGISLGILYYFLTLEMALTEKKKKKQTKVLTQ